MSLPVKLGVVGALGAGATATYFGVFHFSMPEWRPLSKDSNNASSYSSKYAENYQQFLVGVNSSTSSDNSPISNDAWWDWSFKYRYDQKKAKGGFGENLVTRGAKGNTADGKSLQEGI